MKEDGLTPCDVCYNALFDYLGNFVKCECPERKNGRCNCPDAQKMNIRLTPLEAE